MTDLVEAKKPPRPKLSTVLVEAVSWRGFLAATVTYCTSSVIGRIAGERIPHWATRRWSDSVVRRTGIELLAEGVDKITPAAPCVIAVNHCSQLDIPVLGAVLSEIDYRWVFKRELFRVPFIGWHLWAAGHIAVDRKRGGNFEKMNAKVDAVFARKQSVLFFPEGTRSRDGALQKFHSGAFNTAVRTGNPVLPIVLEGTEHLLTKGSIAFPRGRKTVRVRVLDPVPAPEPGEDFAGAVQELMAQVRGRMVETLDELRGAPGAAERPTI